MATNDVQLRQLAADLSDVYTHALDAATRRYIVSNTSLTALEYAADGVRREAQAQPEAAIQTSERTWRASEVSHTRKTLTVVKLMGADSGAEVNTNIEILAQLSRDAAACAVKSADLVSTRALTSGTNSQVQFAAHALAQDLEAYLTSHNRTLGPAIG